MNGDLQTVRQIFLLLTCLNATALVLTVKFSHLDNSAASLPISPTAPSWHLFYMLLRE